MSPQPSAAVEWRPRDRYPNDTLQSVRKWCVQHGWKISGFRSPMHGDVVYIGSGQNYTHTVDGVYTESIGPAASNPLLWNFPNEKGWIILEKRT